MDKQALEFLADKYGTTVEMLWQALIFQARIDACVLMFVDVLFLVVCVFLYWKFTRHAIRKSTSFNDVLDDEKQVIVIAVSALCLVVFVVLTPFAVRDAVTAFFNPNAAAMEYIFRK